MASAVLVGEGIVARSSTVARKFARGRHKPGQLNGLERDYQTHLEAQRLVGTVEWFIFEGIKLRLADNTFYTPDFFVMGTNGLLECHEVKGFWEDDARVKIKVAALLFPFLFLGVQRVAKKHGGGWKFETF